MWRMTANGYCETKGDDVEGFIRLIRERRPELANVALVYVSTPDFKGAFQDGWAATVTRMVETLVEIPDGSPRLGQVRGQVNVLPGCHLSPGDIEELREIIEAFGLAPVILPDLSDSLDGHIPDDFTPTTLGGATLADIASMGRSELTLAIGEQMRPAAAALEARTGVPFVLFERLTGLLPNDAFLMRLSELSGRPVPAKYRRQRSQLEDAMLDGHFFFGGCKVALGAEPDLLYAVGSFLVEMGCQIAAAVTTTESPLLERLPCDEVLIGDLEDLEQRAGGCDLLLTHAHGRQLAERLELPFFRLGLPMFDRLGAAHQLTVGYRGTRGLVFDIGNLLLAHGHEPGPDDWRLPDAHEPAAATAAID